MILQTLRILGVLLLFLFIFIYANKPVLAQEYYFQDEFNNNRSPNTLDSSKWTVFPNTTSSFTSISEMNGFANFTQLNNRTQFPYVHSKNALPDNDFSAEIKFQYTEVTFWGTGINLSKDTPLNGGSSNTLLDIRVWQDRSLGPSMRIEFDGPIVYSTPINLLPHTVKIDRLQNVYYIFLDNQLIYTSAKSREKVNTIWMGNPILSSTPIPNWTKFKVDYIRVKSLNPKPFLDLPWNYKEKGLNFNEAATIINSFFDHEYPLISSGINEPNLVSKSITKFEGLNTTESYSSHDGYDYGKPAKVYNEDPVLAAADGIATFTNDCKACGNAIHIDHSNGYQTRYYHLQKIGLITDDEDAEVTVTARQQIGKVGSTGNSTGAHIHFMVIQDKNNDGSFDDNIPDGITDPFGWQSTEDDPWEIYSFIQGGINKTGNKSYYLWKEKLDGLDETLTSNGGVFNVGRYQVNIPSGITNQNLNLEIKSTPATNIFEEIVSVGSTIRVEARDNFGTLITQYPKLFTILVDFKILNLDGYKTSTLSFYSSPDGLQWTKEPTEIDLINKTAKTSVNHMSYFALAAERLDTIAPSTAYILHGEQGQENWFRSDISLQLNAHDNEDGIGVDYTLYRIDGMDWETYTNPLLFTEEGNYKIEFYSADNDENFEEVQSVQFTIDKTSPVVNLLPERSPDNNDWYNRPIVAKASSNDENISNCDEPFEYSTPNNINASISSSCIDKAGNIGTDTIYFKYDSSPPIINLQTDPIILWPPNGKLMNVTVTGYSNDDYLDTTNFFVYDEYNELQPLIEKFNQTIQLEARRNGDDKDGRKYIIKVFAKDLAGNQSTSDSEVLVLHDKD